MKDTEAREQIDALQRSLAELPQKIADIVIAHFEPRISQVNEAVEAMHVTTASMKALDETLSKLAADTSEQGDLFSLVGDDVTALRKEVAEAHAVVSDMDQIKSALRAFAEAAGKVA